MIYDIVRFLLHVLASTCGILVGVWLAGMWDKFREKRKSKRRKKR